MLDHKKKKMMMLMALKDQINKIKKGKCLNNVFLDNLEALIYENFILNDASEDNGITIDLECINEFLAEIEYNLDQLKCRMLTMEKSVEVLEEKVDSGLFNCDEMDYLNKNLLEKYRKLKRIKKNISQKEVMLKSILEIRNDFIKDCIL